MRFYADHIHDVGGQCSEEGHGPDYTKSEGWHITVDNDAGFAGARIRVDRSMIR